MEKCHLLQKTASEKEVDKELFSLTMIFPASDGYRYFQGMMTAQCIRFTRNASGQA